MNAWIVLAAALAFGIAPFVTEGFAGFRPDQFPIPQDNAPVQPAGYAFSIWGVIYTWLLVSALWGVWRHRDDVTWEPARLPLALSMFIGSIWIKVATLSVIWATVLIWVMLLSALWALVASRGARPLWALSLPLGLYAGWLSAASLVALGLTGAGYGILLDQLQWAIAAVVAALILGSTIARMTPATWSYPLALAWALIGVAVANWPETATMAGLAAGAAVFFVAQGTWNLRRHLAP